MTPALGPKQWASHRKLLVPLCLKSQFPRQVDGSAQDRQTFWVFSAESGQSILQPWVETLVWLKPAGPTGISY